MTSTSTGPERLVSEGHYAPDTPVSSPSIHVTSEGASTDSMVTVRLSQPPSEFYDAFEQHESGVCDSRIEPVPELKRLDSIDILHGNVFGTQVHNENPRLEPAQFDAANDISPRFVTQHRSDSFPVIVEDDEFNDVEANPWRPRSESSSSSKSHVDWNELERTEEEETKNEVSDESTAFLLARLEQENNALATDPRFGLRSRPRKQSRPPSMQVLKRLVQDPSVTRSSRYSLVPNPPPMTELEFWAALVKDYPQTVQRLPTLTANKIKAGVPPPLRGVVWVSMVGARDAFLEEQFDKLLLESSPYEGLIGKDIGRSFPGVEMFREADGEGQQMLARVLKCFSLYDKEIGYCQGLGFLVGPLLMQMGDKDAFCVLVKLMENYNLRSCFLPDLSGLHLRIYQFKHLLDQHMPTLAAHLASLQVEAAYLSQWFLSFFAVTCPLPMLFRIYDVIFAEGASETIMRVALSLMKRNEQRIMESSEFEEVMHLLLSRSLWEPYGCNADDLVNDFADMTGVVTRDSLETLEASFKHARATDPGAWYAFLPDATAAASRFLGRLWTASTPLKAGGLSPSQAITGLSRPSSFLRRSPSKHSISASLNSTDMSSESNQSIATVTTDLTVTSRESTDMALFTPKSESIAMSKGDKDLHGQIEDLLTALSDLQRQQSLLAAQLQREKEERGEDHQAFRALVHHLRPNTEDKQQTQARRKTMDFSNFEQTSPSTIEEKRKTLPNPQILDFQSSETLSNLDELILRATERIDLFKDIRPQRTSQIFETKQRLQESLSRSREQLETEKSNSMVLAQQIEEQGKDIAQAKERLHRAEARIRDQEREKENLEQTIQELIDVGEIGSPLLSRNDTGEGRLSITSLNAEEMGSEDSVQTSPVSEVRIRSDSLLGKALANSQANNQMNASSIFSPRGDSLSNGQTNVQATTQSGGQSLFPQRGASLATQGILNSQRHTPASEDDLLVELVNVKTSEAAARQELEEVRSELEAMRKMFGPISPSASNGHGAHHRPSPSESTVIGSSAASGVFSSAASFFSSAKTNTANGTITSSDGKLTPPAVATPGATATNASLAGSFWGWGKKSTSNTPTTTPAKEPTEVQVPNGMQATAGATDLT